MPTIPASTGGSTGKKGKLASFPRTKNTSSPTPAPTASTATSGRPTGSRDGARGWTSSSLRPVNDSSLRVATTSPITRARCMGAPSWIRDVNRVDDSNNGGVDWAILHPRRHAGRAPADDEHGLPDAGVDGV